MFAAVAALAVAGIVLVKHAAGLGSLLRVPSAAPAQSNHKPAGSRRAGARDRTARRRPTARRLRPRARGAKGGVPESLMRSAPAYLALAGWVGLLALAISAATTVDRRLRNRLTRAYRRHEIKLSMHDDTKPGDLEDMVEALGAAVRRRYNDRVSDGQPFFAVELLHRPSEAGAQWTLCLVCEAQIARTLEGIIASAYPDIRIGREFDEEPQPFHWPLEAPGYVLRFRKRRPFIHPLSSPAPLTSQRHGKTTPLIEAVAMTQCAVGSPSVVRLQLMPASEQLEDRARRKLERHEQHRLEHHHRAGTTLEHAEMRSAVEIRHRSMFYLELQVGSDDWETCNRIAASLVARRGENHLHRRYMVIRQGLYRRRFGSAYPPLWPPLSMRTLVSGGELAHLLELPSARMKGVPVRRLTIPRMPAPPDAFRATDLEPLAVPGPKKVPARKPLVGSAS